MDNVCTSGVATSLGMQDYSKAAAKINVFGKKFFSPHVPSFRGQLRWNLKKNIDSIAFEINFSKLHFFFKF